MLIYEPTGKAREYSPLALNVYAGGCDHQCSYCYCRNIVRGDWSKTGSPRNLDSLDREAKKCFRQILLCFMGDPYSQDEIKYRQTRAALEILKRNKCSVAILTKGGERCLDDLGIFRSWPDGRIKVGATLTFKSEHASRKFEPGAQSPLQRVEALKVLHEAGIQTWASIEPVIYPADSLAIIEASLPYVDAYKVGKLNHRSTDVDWKAFCLDAVSLIRSAGKKLYVKYDLAEFVPAGFLTAEETDCDHLVLPDRPNGKLTIKNAELF